MKRFEIIEKFYLSKALLAGGEMHPPPLDLLLTETLLFQTMITALVKVGCDMFYYSIRTVEHRWRLGSFEDTTSVRIVAGKLV